jgi:hypothetical protein
VTVRERASANDYTLEIAGTKTPISDDISVLHWLSPLSVPFFRWFVAERCLSVLSGSIGPRSTLLPMQKQLWQSRLSPFFRLFPIRVAAPSHHGPTNTLRWSVVGQVANLRTDWQSVHPGAARTRSGGQKPATFVSIPRLSTGPFRRSLKSYKLSREWTALKSICYWLCVRRFHKTVCRGRRT